jgi:hypothetical protein
LSTKFYKSKRQSRSCDYGLIMNREHYLIVADQRIESIE